MVGDGLADADAFVVGGLGEVVGDEFVEVGLSELQEWFGLEPGPGLVGESLVYVGSEFADSGRGVGLVCFDVVEGS